MANISQFFDKAYEQQEFSQLADAPVDAIEGLNKNDSEGLEQAFNVKPVRAYGSSCSCPSGF
jgi:antitoxin component HigA of HigAB toxin-antitoxin module